MDVPGPSTISNDVKNSPYQEFLSQRSKHRNCHPYDDETKKNLTMPFTEHYGLGTPAASLGATGDIYFDVSLKAEVLYGKTDTDEWLAWKGPKLRERRHLVRHPRFERFLWCFGTGRVQANWFKEEVISGKKLAGAFSVISVIIQGC